MICQRNSCHFLDQWEAQLSIASRANFFRALTPVTSICFECRLVHTCTSLNWKPLSSWFDWLILPALSKFKWCFLLYRKDSLSFLFFVFVLFFQDTLTVCWAFDPEKRPTFSSLLRTLERLPKHRQRLHRSPSQPCTVGRGAEALIWHEWMYDLYGSVCVWEDRIRVQKYGNVWVKVVCAGASEIVLSGE